jgi:hypothetical protein
LLITFIGSGSVRPNPSLNRTRYGACFRRRVECIIDELVVGDESEPGRFLLTSAHPGESVAEGVRFAQSLTMEYDGEVQVVEV